MKMKLTILFTLVLSACGVKPPSLEAVTFPIKINNGDELWMSCENVKGEKAVLPLDVPQEVKEARQIVYFVNGDWKCTIQRKTL